MSLEIIKIYTHCQICGSSDYRLEPPGRRHYQARGHCDFNNLIVVVAALIFDSGNILLLTAVIIGLLTADCGAAAETSPQLAAQPNSSANPEMLVWRPGVKGTQYFWHAWPDRIYDGPIVFAAKAAESIPDGFTFEANNVYGHCAYKATRVSSEPNKLKPSDARLQQLNAHDLSIGHLPKTTVSGQPITQIEFPAEISKINSDGSAFTAVFAFASEDVTCKVERTTYKVTLDPVPDIRDLRYGPHFRQTIDFYRAKSDKPTPLVITIHGGGLGAGAKTGYGGMIPIQPFLSHGISVASIDYRFLGMAAADKVEPPVAAPFLDAARAVQFLRYHAAELNIDQNLVAAGGCSAGALISLWLGFHKDLANPSSPDPVARKSTRLVCAVATDSQTSLDPQQMKDWLPGLAFYCDVFDLSIGWNDFQRFLDRRDEWLAKGYIQEFSPWALVTHDSPPVCLGGGLPMDGKIDVHSPRWDFELKKKMAALGVECHFNCLGITDPEFSNVDDFMTYKLKEAASAKPSKIKP